MTRYPNDQGNPAGAIPVYLAPAPSAASTNLHTAATTELKAASGYLTGISINTGVAGKTIKLYDGDPGAGGTLLGTWSAAAQNAVALSIAFAASLWAVTDGVADITVSFV